MALFLWCSFLVENSRDSRNSNWSGHSHPSRSKLPPIGQGRDDAHADASRILLSKLKVLRARFSRGAVVNWFDAHYRLHYQVNIYDFDENNRNSTKKPELRGSFAWNSTIFSAEIALNFQENQWNVRLFLEIFSKFIDKICNRLK